MQAVVFVLEFVVDTAQVAAAIGGEEAAGIDGFLAIAETGAEHPRDPLVPGQLHEGLRIGDADQFRRFRPVADVIAVAVGIQIGGGAVDQLKAAFGDGLPMVGGDALADDAPGHRDELVIDVGDPQLVDFLANLFNQIGPAVGIHMVVEFHFYRLSRSVNVPSARDELILSRKF